MDDQVYDALAEAVKTHYASLLHHREAFRNASLAYLGACRAEFDARIASGDDADESEANYIKRMDLYNLIPKTPTTCNSDYNACMAAAGSDTTKQQACKDTLNACLSHIGDYPIEL